MLFPFLGGFFILFMGLAMGSYGLLIIGAVILILSPFAEE